MVLAENPVTARTAARPVVAPAPAETVTDRMAPAVTVAAGADVGQVVDIMLRRRAAAIAVVDEYGRILGAIDSGEYPDLFDTTGARVAGTARQRRRRERRATATAEELMAPALVVPAAWPPARAWAALAAAGARFAFVVDELGRVIGGVTVRGEAV
ncbi:CBS domain-containing protein [Dactylosporangium sp. CA-233914]|uniref:CBS domain-containing protein n=1 Tax=Dactylosporangium sp. CA-233914 TaxID=3239934 RepID=UPI003D94B1A6